jgi:hypothetical protein
MKNKIIAVLGVLSFASAFAPTSFAAEQPADRSSHWRPQKYRTNFP